MFGYMGFVGHKGLLRVYEDIYREQDTQSIQGT